ncbi:hypothetical protein C3942_00740 [Solimonas fluminis]|uniref:Uncharacterized protein n=1 Tax=Solimonas fluminis TaxID=2086571 RepID=A0A2S5TKE3_9GAMM|nr:hypothetical protein C3942_00740 [Solimonas fluminis]
MPKKRDAVSSLARWLLIIFLGIPALVGFLAAVSSGGTDSPASPKATAKKEDSEAVLAARACSEAQRAVRARLKAPATAEFPGCVFGMHEYVIKSNPERTKYFVQGFVDAENSFGAKLRNKFGVILTRNGESWTADKVAIE